MLTAKLLFGFGFLQLLILTEATDPCANDGHRTIPNEGLRYADFKTSPSETPNHDSRLLEGWYYVGNTTMPESPPAIFSCGTKFPIWLNGHHPTGSRELVCPKCACVNTRMSNCSQRYDVKIKYCPRPNDFYLYYLKPTYDVTEGYCFGSSPTYVSPKPNVTFRLHTVFVNGLPISRVRFHCDFTMSMMENLFYRVSWWREDAILYTTPYATDSMQEELLLTEELFKQKGFNMGDKISCTVRPFDVIDGPPGGQSAKADAEFVGIKILTPTLSFQNGEKNLSKRTIRLKPTVPIGCFATEKCSIWLTAFTNANVNGKCSGVVLERTSCGASINSHTYDKELHIPITTQETGMYTTRAGIYYVYLKTGDTAENNLWKNYYLPPIKVLVTPQQTQTYMGRKCFAHSDTHMATFDGKLYESQHAGVFTLYKHPVLDAEVQIKHGNCDPQQWNYKQCLCGVAVRAGQDTYAINLCDQKISLGYITCGDATVTAKMIDSSHYKIILPYGTYVVVTVLTKPYAGKSHPVLNVDVIPSLYDANSASIGLCGRLDGDCLNDFHIKDGSATKNYCLETLGLHNQPVDFLKAWLVTSQTENIFDPNFNDANQAKPWQHIICGCDEPTDGFSFMLSNAVQCQTNTVATCTNRGGKAINGQCNGQGHHIFPTVSVPSSVIVGRKKRAESNNRTWTEAEAKEYCDKYMKTTPIFDTCGKVLTARTEFSVATCVSDIMHRECRRVNSTA